MSPSTDEEILADQLSRVRPPEPRSSGTDAIAFAHQRIVARRRRRASWGAAGTAFGVILFAGGSVLALQHTGPARVGSAAGQEASLASLSPVSAWAARGSMLADKALVSDANKLVAKQAAGATVDTLYAGSVYGGQGRAVVLRWESPSGWRVAFVTSSLVGLQAADGSSAGDLALRSILAVPDDGALPAYVGFTAVQGTRDGGKEALAFALSAPGVGSGTFRVATMEAPESDGNSSTVLEDGVSAAVVSAEAGPWNTYLSTVSAGSFGLLGSAVDAPAPVPVQPAGSAARADGLVEMSTTGKAKAGDIVTSPVGVYGTVERALSGGHVLVKPDILSASAHLSVYSFISNYAGKLLPTDTSGAIARFVPDDSTVASDVNRVVGKPSSDSEIVVGVGRTIPGAANLDLEALEGPTDVPLYLISSQR